MSLIDNIKALFEAKTKENFSIEEFKDIKLADGSIIRIEGDLKEGAKVSIISEDGTVTISGEKTYTLEDGTIISVKADGTIETITAPELNAVESEVEIEAPEATEEVKPEDNRLTAAEAKIAELEAAITLIAEQIKGLPTQSEEAMAEVKDIKKENKELKKQVKELASQPAVADSDFKKVEFSTETSNNKPVKNNEMLNRILSLKEKSNK